MGFRLDDHGVDRARDLASRELAKARKKDFGLDEHQEEEPAEGVRSSSPLLHEVFLCDASAEADRLQAALRARNYPVVDVPPGLIGMRIRYERPLSVILDADLKDAERILTEIREASGGATRVILLGERGQALDSPAFPAHLARLRYYRPIDVEQVLTELVEVLGPPQQRDARSRAPRAPVLMAATRRPVRADSLGTIHPPQTRIPESDGPNRYVPSLPPLPSDPGEILGAMRARTSPSARPRSDSAGASGLSPETRAVLEQGRRRVRMGQGSSSPLARLGPTADAELPSDSPLLAALARPLDELSEVDTGSESEDSSPDATGQTPLEEEATRAGGGPLDARWDVSTHVFKDLPKDLPRDLKADFEDPTNPGRRLGALSDSASSKEIDSLLVDAPPPEIPLEDSELTGPSTIPGMARAKPIEIKTPEVSLPEPPTLALARAVRERFTGSLAQQTKDGLRRIFLREGDIHSFSSSRDLDALVPFLERQGRFTPEMAQKLRPLPRAVRSAGASLVASGHLSRDELLPTLRAHGEWLLSQILTSKNELLREQVPTDRVPDEGSIFGATTGAEVFVNAIRRIRSPEEALARFGDPENWVALGAYSDLFFEAHLEQELESFEKAQPTTFLTELARKDPARLVALSGLLDLGAITVGPADDLRQADARGPGSTDRPGRRDSLSPRSAPIEARLEARLRLVQESDYFTFLGVDRGATEFEIERAYERLKSEFSPDRLSPELRHRDGELSVIRKVIEEAHLILGDSERRNRYLRALTRNEKRREA